MDQFVFGSQSRHDEQPFGPAVEDKKAPGYMWKNKAAQREFSEAQNNFIDKDFDPHEYGDLLENEAREWSIGKPDAKTSK